MRKRTEAEEPKDLGELTDRIVRRESCKGRAPMRSLGLATLVAFVGCSSAEGEAAIPVSAPAPDVVVVVADLRADANRDGEVTFDERDAEKLAWDRAHGAVFLANIDDDTRRCKAAGTDVELPKCNDAADAVLNGPDDAKDLARLRTRPWADAPDDALATVTIVTESAKEKVRLFVRTGAGEADFLPLAEDGALTLDEFRRGAELAIEAKDIVRDPAVWDGFVTLRLTVTALDQTVTDDVRLRVAPVLTSHHLQPAEEIFVSDTGSPGNRAMRADLREACEVAGAPAPTEIREQDPWTQDFFETAWMSMPAPGGTQHVVRVNLRSANVFDPSDKVNPLRPAGQLVFALRGPDTAGVQQFDARHDPRTDSLNSFGNLETIPPFTKGGETFPFGRLLRGGTPSFRPDLSFSKMIEAQGVQPPVDIDTSWLLVGHVDETISFVHAKSPRGWAVLVNDPRLAKTILEDLVAKGEGETPMFVGKYWFDERGRPEPAQATIREVLADTDVMSASAEAAAEIDAQLAVLKREIGLTEDDLVRVPFLHHAYGGGSVAYQPGTVNGIYVADGHFVAPKPHGPIVGGKDPFEEQLASALAKHGVAVSFAEDWSEYHAALGEVHCGTNARRRVPDAKWWESGR